MIKILDIVESVADKKGTLRFQQLVRQKVVIQKWIEENLLCSLLDYKCLRCKSDRLNDVNL